MSNPQPTGDKLLALWRSGDLAKAAAGCATEKDLAINVGLTLCAYRSAAQRLRSLGHAFPRFQRGGGLDRPRPACPGCSDCAMGNVCTPRAESFEDEVTSERWPSVAAFDAEQVTGGLPAEPMPVGHHLRGVSTLLGADGSIKAQWIKTAKDDEDRYQALLAALEEAAKPWASVADPIPAPSHVDDDLMCAYLMGDPHIGMHAWAEEAGDNFDLEIAERNLYTAVDHLAALAPPAKHALVLNLGDFFHADGKAATTTKGTRVDVDTRWPKVLTTGVRLMRRIIERALDRHEHVTVINEIGNHDDHSSIMLSICLSQFFERETRVTVDTSPEAFHWHRFGDCFIGANHGNLVKHRELGEVMAATRPRDWGETRYRHIYVGHVHHDSVKELRGVTVETLRTLATSDDWHRRSGYRSDHDMKMDVWHRKHGRINRHIVGIEQVRGGR